MRQELSLKVQSQRDILKKIEPFERELLELQEAAANQDESNTTSMRKKKHHKDPLQIQAKIDDLRKEIEALDAVEKNGWILIDFPSTFA